MIQSLLIVYSNLGLGGIPVRIVDIVNAMKSSHPKIKILILLKERRIFDLRSTIINSNVTIKDFYMWSPFDNQMLFVLWIWLFIFTHKQGSILSFISPYALPVLATKILFFWRKSNIIINEGHYTSTMIKSMALPAIQRWGVRLLYPLANTIIVPTREIMKDLHISFNIPINKMVIVPNWSRYAKFPLNKTARQYDIIYTGRIEKTKNILHILAIMDKLIHENKLSISCLLVGEGSSLTECREFITSHDLIDNAFIYPPTTNISDYLKKSKIFIFYPEVKTEGFPVAILDAMSCGTVVITKEFCGVHEVINHTNGYIVKTDKEMSDRLLYVLRHYKSHQPVIRRAKYYVSRYNSPDNIRHYAKWFTS